MTTPTRDVTPIATHWLLAPSGENGRSGSRPGLRGNPLFKDALSPYKGGSLTKAGRALTKHPEVVGATNQTLRTGLRADAAINKAAATQLKDIRRNGARTAPNPQAYQDPVRGMTAVNEQRFERWEPLSDIPARMYLEALHDDVEGVRMLLRGGDPGGRVLRLSFEPIAYRNINESHRLGTWASLDMGGMTSLMTLANSSWLRWLVEEAAGVIAAESLTHYAIYTPEDCIDVATSAVPVAEWL